MKLVNNHAFLLELLVCKAVTARSWLIAPGKWPLRGEQKYRWNCFDYRRLGSLLNILYYSHIPSHPVTFLSSQERLLGHIDLVLPISQIICWVYPGKMSPKGRQLTPNSATGYCIHYILQGLRKL